LEWWTTFGCWTPPGSWCTETIWWFQVISVKKTSLQL
jgi:hypothetical protein